MNMRQLRDRLNQIAETDASTLDLPVLFGAVDFGAVDCENVALNAHPLANQGAPERCIRLGVPPSAVAVSSVAHVVRNALVPARHRMEQIRDASDNPPNFYRTHAKTALKGIETVLDFVDRLVASEQRSERTF